MSEKQNIIENMEDEEKEVKYSYEKVKRNYGGGCCCCNGDFSTCLCI